MRSRRFVVAAHVVSSHTPGARSRARASAIALAIVATAAVAHAQPPLDPPDAPDAPTAETPPEAPPADPPTAETPPEAPPEPAPLDEPSEPSDQPTREPNDQPTREPNDEPSAPSPPDARTEPGSDPSEEDRLPEAHRPTLGVVVRADEVRTGDLVRLVITAEVPEGDDVAMPEQRLGTFEIHDRRHRSEPVANGARRRFVLELDLLALEPGEQELPPIRLRVVTADGQVGTVQTEARTIRVGSHLANEPDAQPRPATRPVPVLEEDYTLLWVLGALLALLITAVVSWLLARWWSRRPVKAAPAPPPRPPWEIAIEALEAIQREKSALIAGELQVELVDRVSDVLRDYLGQRYDFNGLESTTDEVVTRLSKVKLRGVALDEITALLADSDLVKFAKAVPDEAQCDRMLEGAFRIVRATTPRPDAIPTVRPEVGDAPARVVTRDGEVVLPVTAHTIEEAERAVRAAIGAAFREVAADPSFEGTLRVVLAPTLRPDANATDALRRLHTRLSRELATVPLPNGRKARIVFEHAHSHRPRSGEAERPVVRTVIDESGVRVEGARPESEAAPPAEARSEPVTPTTPPSEETVETAARREPDARAAASAEAAASPPPSRERVKTGPVEWDRAALAEAPTVEAPVRPSVDARALDRVLPTFQLEGDAPSGALLRWVTGLPRPVVYRVGDDELLGASALGALGLTRGGLHERALNNLRRSVPPGFAPGDEPALLDDPTLTTILALPELVPIGHAWLAYPVRGEGLFVLREDALTTRHELTRLASLPGGVFEQPVRVSRRGFEPVEWPSAERSTDPGFAAPEPKTGGEP